MRRLLRRFGYDVHSLCDFLKWIYRRDSESASMVLIDLSFDLNQKDLIAMRDLLDSLYRAEQDREFVSSRRTKSP